MHYSLITNLINFLFIFYLSINSVLSKNIENELIADQLEKSLNNNNNNSIKELFLKSSYDNFKNKYINFTKDYRDAKWSIQVIRNQKDKKYLDIGIKAKRNLGNQIYDLVSKQIVELSTYKNKIQHYKVLKEESILKSNKNPLKIKINSPDRVLTGERYQIDLIIEKPLDNSLIAGGMVVIQNNKSETISQNYFGIKPTGSGGLFKYIQAPLKPGYQNISAVIAHPEGIYSITKKVEIISQF